MSASRPSASADRKLKAIVVADIVGYSSMTYTNEERTLRGWMLCIGASLNLLSQHTAVVSSRRQAMAFSWSFRAPLPQFGLQ